MFPDFKSIAPALICITAFPSSGYYILSNPTRIDERNPCLRTITSYLLNLESSLHQVYVEQQGLKPALYLKHMHCFLDGHV